MRITREDFNKLSFEDRMEMRYDRDKIEERTRTLTNELLNAFFKILGFVFIVDILLFNYGVTNFFYELSSPLFYILIFFAVGGFIYDIFMVCIRSRDMRLLENKYFKIELKKKRCKKK